MSIAAHPSAAIAASRRAAAGASPAWTPPPARGFARLEQGNVFATGPAQVGFTRRAVDLRDREVLRLVQAIVIVEHVQLATIEGHRRARQCARLPPCTLPGRYRAEPTSRCELPPPR